MSTILSDRMLQLMDPKDRAPMGKAGVTNAEAQAKFEAASERDLQNLIAQYLRQHDIPFIRQSMNKKTTGMPGWPDFAFPHKGRFFAVECKVGDNKLTKDQEACKAMILANGGIYVEARDLHIVKVYLEMFL